MKNTDQLTKEEIVQMIHDGVIYHDRHGLLKLVKEWIELAAIIPVTRDQMKVTRSVDSVKGLANYEISMEDSVDFDLDLVRTLKPVAFEVVRDHFQNWVEKNKSPSLAAWVKDNNATITGLTFKRAGLEAKRYNDGVRYLIKIPGLVVVKRRKSQAKVSA